MITAAALVIFLALPKLNPLVVLLCAGLVHMALRAWL
jgi:hypothetical protein